MEFLILPILLGICFLMLVQEILNSIENTEKVLKLKRIIIDKDLTKLKRKRLLEEIEND